MVALRKISSFACYFNSVLIFSRGGKSLTTQDGLWGTVGEEALDWLLRQLEVIPILDCLASTTRRTWGRTHFFVKVPRQKLNLTAFPWPFSFVFPSIRLMAELSIVESSADESKTLL